MSLLGGLVEWFCRVYGMSLGRLVDQRIILCYHNVGRAGESRGWLDDARLLDTADFEAQMRWLASHCKVVTLERLLDDRPIRGRAVAITFDDGYYNNIDQVLPILRQSGLPVTWFVATAYVDDARRLPWWDLLDLLLRRGEGRIRLSESEFAGEYDLDDPGQGQRLRFAARRAFKSAPPDRRDALERELRDLLEDAGALPDNAFARAAEIAAIDYEGLELGGHTSSHPNLARCDADERSREIVEGKRRLEQICGRPARWFAYPYGDRGSFDTASAQSVRQAGFSAALTLEPGLVRAGGNPYRIPRIGVSPGTSLASFEARVAGAPIHVLAQRLRRRFAAN